MIDMGIYTNKITCELRVRGNVNGLDVVIDTGNIVSILSNGYVEELFGTKFYAVVERARQERLYQSERVGSLYVTPSYICDVEVNGNIRLDKLYFCLTDKLNEPVIGLDFLMASNWTYDSTTGIMQIHSIDAAKYESNISNYLDIKLDEFSELRSNLNQPLRRSAGVSRALDILRQAQGN